jgi:crotonobetainyl-CoA:carnitine CoA-transferase CaiB-like acyl-CoA transferase
MTRQAAPHQDVDVRSAASGVLTGLALAPATDLEVGGTLPVLPSCFAVDVAAAATVGATSLTAARLWHLRGGPGPRATVDIRHAALSFRSERYLRIDAATPTIWGELSGNYRGADGWILLHANYPAHHRAILRALDVPADRGRVAAALTARTVVEAESAIVAAGGVAAAMRTRTEWADHPQSAAVAGLPLIEFTGIGDSPALPLSPADRPLETVRVLDLTRVIAGPVAGRTLAGYGAQVLRVGADHLALVPSLAVDTGFGKRFCHLDLRTERARATLRGLVAQADVVLQAYRPAALARLGFGPVDLAAIRPGLVYVSISAWGNRGPWRGRRGFDSLVQMASGIADEGARMAAADQPRPLPAQALDHATGWLAALAAIEGLHRRHTVGGSWHAQLSLVRTRDWLDSLGRVVHGLDAPEPDPSAVMSTMDSPYGTLDYVRQPGTVAGQVPVWHSPPHLPGADPPRWVPS